MAWSVVSLRIAYLGWNYHGVVEQPSLPTVGSALREAMESQGIRAKLRFTSRTDRGVSALDNIAFYRGPAPNVSLLNSELPKDIAVWAIATGGIPKPKARAYCYAIPFRLSETECVRRALDELAQAGLGKNIERIDVKSGENFTYIEIYGKSFKKNEIRRIVGRALELHLGRSIGLAPPEGLVLTETLTDMKWEEFHRRKLHLIGKMIERELWRLESSRIILGIIKSISSSLL
ncbi:tRNA pseudouridine synthase [Candidatus Korarchaeum cryptofilum]|uniref:tRNA pseudouridine synthase n=1 Tax=Korarchaeum cryptofilum (strain OPF8) TaxID=374847 RepID=B1L7C6_KORCO|nr:tRNA pseudouridine synthase [Candidatus Korarchaeum cryptofilum]ACB08355.1 tRNA pseudouridine synthase [Candidatus Korarchaeum cryptofilum OPF8]